MKSFRKPGYVERLNKQTLDWVNGNPKHNYTDGECCPDFSCCNPELLAAKEVRELFYKADQTGNDKVRSRMLGEFLGKMVDAMPDKTKVHIVGLDVSRQELD
jgi:hypothetical protein